MGGLNKAILRARLRILLLRRQSVGNRLERCSERHSTCRRAAHEETSMRPSSRAALRTCQESNIIQHSNWVLFTKRVKDILPIIQIIKVYINKERIYFVCRNSSSFSRSHFCISSSDHFGHNSPEVDISPIDFPSDFSGSYSGFKGSGSPNDCRTCFINRSQVPSNNSPVISK